MKGHDDLMHGIFNALVTCICLYAAYRCFARGAFALFIVEVVLSLANLGFAVYYFVECANQRKQQ